jgi:hypothetical protein
MTRTITEILKEADQASEMKDLVNLWNEIAENIKKYSLVEVEFAFDHIRDLACNLTKNPDHS